MKNALLISSLLLLCGCAGSHCLITVRDVDEPVSCTAMVFDADGRIRGATRSEVVRHITLTTTRWSVFWRAIPLGRREWDLSSELKSHLKETSGNAVVNVTVKSTSSDFFHSYVAALVPVIPTYVKVKVEADVVRMSEPGS